MIPDEVRLTKYFHVLRPLLAIRYIEQGHGIPPMEFERLSDAAAPREIRPGIEKLLELKRNTPELGLGAPIAEIGRFIENELHRHGDRFSGQGRPDILDGAVLRDKLNEAFRGAMFD